MLCKKHKAKQHKRDGKHIVSLLLGRFNSNVICHFMDCDYLYHWTGEIGYFCV